MKIREAIARLERWEAHEDQKERLRAKMRENGRLFHPANIRRITEPEFQKFLSFNGNLHWHGLQRHPEVYRDNMERLQDSLAILVDESREIDARLDDLTVETSANRIKGLREAVLTPILMCVYPKKYAVYNRISLDALKQLEEDLGPLERKGSLGERYCDLNKKCEELRQEVSRRTRSPKTLWLIDVMFSRMVHDSAT